MLRSRGCVLRLACTSSLVLASARVSAEGYSVSYNPYGSVAWETTLRCQSQHHDHASTASRITALSEAGYCAVTYMTYSGAYQAQTAAAWVSAGMPDPDPGVPLGWGEYRRWPPEEHGAPALPLNSLLFYLPGAEESGLRPDGGHTNHMHSLGLTQYLEGVGCGSCGHLRSAVRNHNPLGLPEAQRYATDSELVAKATALGAIMTLNHPNGLPWYFDAIEPFPAAVEIYSNYHASYDEGCGSSFIARFKAVWDHVLETKSARIWGVAVNDWSSAWTPLGDPAIACWPQITEANRDRGKLQVLLTSYDLTAYMAAFAAGAFFAIEENNAIKSAYPTVTSIAVADNQIAISTAQADETITWIGNGQVIGSGASLPLDRLPANLAYARAEIDDGEGRVVYTQPFELAALPPPPPGEPAVPALPALLDAAIVLGLALVLSRSARKRAASAR